MKKLAILFTVFAFVGVAVPAQASFKLYLSDNAAVAPGPGGTFVLVSDGGAGDDDAAVNGNIHYSTTAFGGVWTFTTAIGKSKPVIGTASDPAQDLSWNVTSTAGGTLYLWLTDTDFTAPVVTSSIFSANGTTGSASASGWSGPGEFSTSTLLFSDCGGALVGGFNAACGGSSIPGGTYAITQRVTITHYTGGTSSGDLLLTSTPIPEPSSLVLLGLGLVGLGSRLRARFQR